MTNGPIFNDDVHKGKLQFNFQLGEPTKEKMSSNLLQT